MGPPSAPTSVPSTPSYQPVGGHRGGRGSYGGSTYVQRGERGGAGGYQRGGGNNYHHSSGGYHHGGHQQQRDNKDNSQNANYKTSLCRNFQNGNCKFGATCSYAHGDQDLRTSSSSQPHQERSYPPAHPPAPRPPPSVPTSYASHVAPQQTQVVGSTGFSALNFSAFPPLGGGQPDAR
jgi:Zinc finger C-x8-C-x5-C-x3-H type (and similar)